MAVLRCPTCRSMVEHYARYCRDCYTVLPETGAPKRKKKRSIRYLPLVLIVAGGFWFWQSSGDEASEIFSRRGEVRPPISVGDGDGRSFSDVRASRLSLGRPADPRARRTTWAMSAGRGELCDPTYDCRATIVFEDGQSAAFVLRDVGNASVALVPVSGRGSEFLNRYRSGRMSVRRPNGLVREVDLERDEELNWGLPGRSGEQER